VKVVEEEKYLGVMMHGYKDPCYTAEHRAQCGSRALHGMLFKCVEVGIYRPDIVCSLFDKLVRPVLSYGAQVWGPWMFATWCKDPLNRNNGPEKVHTDFLRQISGMPKFVHKMSLYREFGRQPLLVQWLVLAARWWNNLASKEEDSIGYTAWCANIELMIKQQGKQPIWASLFLKAMHKIGVLQQEVWLQEGLTSPQNIKQLMFDESKVKAAATDFLVARAWEAGKDVDPRRAPSQNVTWATYEQWVAGENHVLDSAKHTRHYMPLPLRRCLLAFRLGCHRLDIQELRMQKSKVPRQERMCRVCGCGEVEDIMHFVLECGHYAHIRARHNNIFSPCMVGGQDKAHALRLVFDHEHQVDLACCLQAMWRERESILQRYHQEAVCCSSQQQLDEEHEDWEDSRYIDLFDSEGSIADSLTDVESSCMSSDFEDELIEVTDIELSRLGFIEIN
jgi:hypothetical protein